MKGFQRPLQPACGFRLSQSGHAPPAWTVAVGIEPLPSSVPTVSPIASTFMARVTNRASAAARCEVGTGRPPADCSHRQAGALRTLRAGFPDGTTAAERDVEQAGRATILLRKAYFFLGIYQLYDEAGRVAWLA